MSPVSEKKSRYGKTEDGNGNEPSARFRCAWEDGTCRCFMLAGVFIGNSDDSPGYCTWHGEAFGMIGRGMADRITDKEAFDQWIEAHRKFYGHEKHAFDFNCAWCKYTKGSLWAALRGFSGALEVEPGVETYIERRNSPPAGMPTEEERREVSKALDKPVHIDKTAQEQIAEAEEAKLF